MSADSRKVNNTFNYELKSPFDYDHKGNVVEAQFITLRAPSSKEISETADLKQAFFRALPKDSTSTGDESEEGSLDDLNGDAIMMMIAISPDVTLKTVLLCARELFKIVATVDGEERMTVPLLDKIDPEDLETMVGEYYLNFVLASWLKKMKDSL